MVNQSYEFDPCTVDGSNEEEKVTLDNWKPTPKEQKLIQSKWRKDSINNNFNQEPGIDDIEKIRTAIKKKYPDHEIMQNYGINAQVLTAIKEGRYHPVEGIKCDNPTKVNNEFKRVDNKLYGMRCAFEYLAQVMFIDKQERRDFLQILNKKKKGSEEIENSDEEE